MAATPKKNAQDARQAELDKALKQIKKRIRNRCHHADGRIP